MTSDTEGLETDGSELGRHAELMNENSGPSDGLKLRRKNRAVNARIKGDSVCSRKSASLQTSMQPGNCFFNYPFLEDRFNADLLALDQLAVFDSIYGCLCFYYGFNPYRDCL